MQVEWIDHLEVDTKEALPKLGALVVDNIKSDIAQGKKGNERPLPDLTEAYERRKLREGGSPLPDLHRTGRLLSQLITMAIGRDWLDVGFTLSGGFGGVRGLKGDADDIKKWRRLKKQGRDPLKISRRDVKRFAKEFVKLGILKEVPGPPKKKKSNSSSVVKEGGMLVRR